MFGKRHNHHVFARTRDEIDAGLAGADRVIVRGDANLLEYARLQVNGSDLNEFDPRASNRPIVLFVALCAALAMVAFFLSLQTLRSHTVAHLAYDRPALVAPSREADVGGVPRLPELRRAPRAPPGIASGPALSDSYVQLIWPVVTVIALVLMYLLAKQAISGGSNVKFAWNITDKVSGQLVITKVRAKF